MAMPMVVEVTFGEDGNTSQVTHHFLFNQWAMRKLEEATGMSVGRLGLILFSGRGGITEQQALVYAGLEGFRWRHKPEHHQQPFTLEEVLRLLDDTVAMDDFKDNSQHPVNAALMKAWKSAFPDKNRLAEEGDTKPGPPVASTSSQTGTTSSTQGSSSE
jgi:hypothetical protein